MVTNAISSLVRNGASIALRLLGALFVAFGLLGSLLLPFVPAPRMHLSRIELLCKVVIALCAVAVGAAVMFRFRLAAIVLSAWFGYLGAEEVYGMVHGFSLPRPPHFSPVEIVGMAAFALVPAVLTAVAWKQLR